MLGWNARLLLGLEKWGLLEGERGARALGEPGPAAGSGLLLEGGCRGEGGTGWLPRLQDAAARRAGSGERWVITVQAHFWLCGYERRLPPACSLTLFAGR